MRGAGVATAVAAAASAESVRCAALLERAQAGAHDAVLAQAETELRAVSGDLADGPAGLHFVRVVSLIMKSAPLDVTMPACDLMLAAAQRTDEQGWLSCAHSIRALQVLEREGERSPEETQAALRDLALAEVALDTGKADAVQACNAHANLGVGYETMRLYELAEPHYTAAHAASLNVPDGGANPMMWSTNLSMLHLQWALELYRVDEVEEAERHSALAAEAARLALGEAAEWGDDIRVALARLQLDCALADGPHVDGVAERMEATLAYLQSVGVANIAFFAAPFRAVALSRTGRHGEALEVVTRAWDDFQGRSELMLAAAISHTHAVLLAEAGSQEAQAALRYGDLVSRQLWTERLRTLHVARTLREFESLRAAHEEVTLTAFTDPLTGLANRRALDDLVRRLGRGARDTDVAVLLVDMDRFKEINDTLGHDAGDETLRRVAATLSGLVRSGDTLARLGGDEFAVVLPGASRESALAVADLAVHAVGSLQELASVSIGVAVRPAVDARAAITAADAAMYVAKRAGGSRAHLAD